MSDDLKKIAEKELRENDKIRQHCIKALRDWIVENPRIIKGRLDSGFLIKHLRFKKFSIPQAQESLERQLLFRAGLYGMDFYSNLDPLKPYVMDLLEKGLIIPLPKRDKHGRLTIYVRFSMIDPSIPDIGNVLFSLESLFMETISEIEINQICGLNYILDLSGVHIKQLLILPIEVWLKIGKYYEKVCMFHPKSIRFVNVNPSFMYLVKIFLTNLPKKIKDRVQFHTANIAETGIVELDNLPIEYGGTVPLKTIMGGY